MTKNKAVTKKKEYINVYTPMGVISYPYIAVPDTGRNESSNKYSAEIYVPKTTWKTEGKPAVDAVLKVAREYFKDPNLTLADFKGPFTDMDKEKDVEDFQKGCIRIRAKAESLFTVVKGRSAVDRKPGVIGPRKDEETNKFKLWTDEMVAAIKGGDYVKLVVSPYGYPQQGGGVAFGLNFVQFIKEGKALGQGGKMAAIKDLEEVEVEADSPDEMVDTEESDDTEGFTEDAEPVKPVKKVAVAKKGKTVPVDEEDPMLSFG